MIRRFRARQRPRRIPGEMNKTEAAYNSILEGRVKLGNVVEYHYESITFKLGPDCRYTPDFIVLAADDVLEAHEVKGFWADDARVKIKVAAQTFPLRFMAFKKQAKKDGGGLSVEEF